MVAQEEWWAAAGTERALLVHDALCPLASAEFLTSMAGHSGPGSVVAFRPVTDTVKTAVDGAIQGTIDRESLAAVTSPVLVAAAALDGEPPLGDFARLVGWLRERGPVELVVAPAIARRVDDASAVNLLESIDELAAGCDRSPRDLRGTARGAPPRTSRAGGGPRPGAGGHSRRGRVPPGAASVRAC